MKTGLLNYPFYHFLEPQVVYIEEQFIEPEHHSVLQCNVEQENSVEIILKRLEKIESKIMDRMDILEMLFVRQNQRIDDVLLGLLGEDIKPTANSTEELPTEKYSVQEISNTVENDLPLSTPTVPETNLEEEKHLTKKNKRKVESPPTTANLNASKKLKQEPLIIIESYYEELPVPVVCQMVSIDGTNDLVLEDDRCEAFIETSNQSSLKVSNGSFLQFPFTNYDDLRKFNKSLQNQSTADEFVRYMKDFVHTNNPVEIPEQILRTVISEQILIESTWASKSSGKLRISYLTNFLKCCLRLGLLFSDNFDLELLRAKTIDLLHAIRVENGLAPQSTKMQKFKAELTAPFTAEKS